jgi:peroxiredoxin
MTRLLFLALSLVAVLARPAVADGGAAASEPAPDFTLATLDGTNVSLSDHLGERVILVHFWSLWCGPCLDELRAADELQRDLGPRGLQVLSISIAEAKDGSRVRATAGRLELSTTVLLDPETRVIALLNPRKVTPWAMVVGTDGLVHHVKIGFTPGDEKQLRAWIEPLLPSVDEAD